MSSKTMVIRAPEGEDEYRCYLRLRYETLREPWGDPEGSELEDDDETAIHRMMIDEDSGEIVGVARLHFNAPGEAQIRLMAIKESHRRQNLGRQLIVEMEAIAHGEGAERIILHARDYAMGFYEKLGYRTIEPSYLLMGQIQHYLMEKTVS